MPTGVPTGSGIPSSGGGRRAVCRASAISSHEPPVRLQDDWSRAYGLTRSRLRLVRGRIAREWRLLGTPASADQRARSTHHSRVECSHIRLPMFDCPPSDQNDAGREQPGDEREGHEAHLSEPRRPSPHVSPLPHAQGWGLCPCRGESVRGSWGALSHRWWAANAHRRVGTPNGTCR